MLSVYANWNYTTWQIYSRNDVTEMSTSPRWRRNKKRPPMAISVPAGIKALTHQGPMHQGTRTHTALLCIPTKLVKRRETYASRCYRDRSSAFHYRKTGNEACCRRSLQELGHCACDNGGCMVPGPTCVMC